MFEWITEREERGQVGIGTLIVFIAMVLVAAIAAGVLINTAGFLQSKSEETGQQSSKQVSDRLQEVVTTGVVNTSESPRDSLNNVSVTVSQSPGADEIDLRNATITWVGESGTHTLTHNSTVDASSTNQYFNVTTVKDSDGSAPVLNDPDDRMKIEFTLGNGTTAKYGPNTGFTSDIGEGDEVTIKINTMSGATTSITFTVPQSLSGKDAVEL